MVPNQTPVCRPRTPPSPDIPRPGPSYHSSPPCSAAARLAQEAEGASGLIGRSKTYLGGCAHKIPNLTGGYNLSERAHKKYIVCSCDWGSFLCCSYESAGLLRSHPIWFGLFSVCFRPRRFVGHCGDQRRLTQLHRCDRVSCGRHVGC